MHYALRALCVLRKHFRKLQSHWVHATRRTYSNRQICMISVFPVLFSYWFYVICAWIVSNRNADFFTSVDNHFVCIFALITASRLPIPVNFRLNSNALQHNTTSVHTHNSVHSYSEFGIGTFWQNPVCRNLLCVYVCPIGINIDFDAITSLWILDETTTVNLVCISWEYQNK